MKKKLYFITLGASIIMFVYGYYTFHANVPTKKQAQLLSRRQVDYLHVSKSMMRKEYAERRQKLFRVLFHEYTRNQKSTQPFMCDYHVIFLTSSTGKSITSSNSSFPFHQDTDLQYLTGLNFPGALFILEYPTISLKRLNNKFADHVGSFEQNHAKYFLFKPPSVETPRAEWKIPEINSLSDINTSFSSTHVSSFVRNRYANHSLCHWYKNTSITDDKDLYQTLKLSQHANKTIIRDITYVIDILRLIKSDIEISLMKQAVSRTVSAFMDVMKSSGTGTIVHQIIYRLKYECKHHGAEQISFTPLVSCGKSLTKYKMHSSSKEDYVIKNGDLLLLDAGCVYQGYSSDITRTWPVNGIFSSPQKHLYAIVLRTSKKCIETCRTGYSLQDVYKVMLMSLADGLQQLDLLPRYATPSELLHQVVRFCPHDVGHYIGLEVHDTPLIHIGLELQPNMIVTVEPGIYIPNDSHVPYEFKGINIRIEDIVVITKDGPVVLSDDLPKEIKEIEAWLS